MPPISVDDAKSSARETRCPLNVILDIASNVADAQIAAVPDVVVNRLNYPRPSFGRRLEDPSADTIGLKK